MANKAAGKANAKLYIAVTASGGSIPEAQDSVLDQAAYDALDWVQVGKTIQLPAFGQATAFNSQAYVGEPEEESIKTTTSFPESTISCRHDGADNGQTAMGAAGATAFSSAVAVKVEMDDAPSGGTPTLRQGRFLVGGPTFPQGGTEDWDLAEFVLKQTGPIVVKAAAAGV